MFGAIVGDIAGSTYERTNFKFEGCQLFAPHSQFTDDTVLTLATAEHFISGDSYAQVYRKFGRDYPNAGYGANFSAWTRSDNPQPYNSWGNGSAMRASPIAWVANDLGWALDEAKKSAEVTHDHPEGIKGAQAVVCVIFLALQGYSKDTIRQEITDRFEYNLDRTLDDIRPGYLFDVSCQGSVPEAIIAFLESTDFESAIRKAISLGGDSDTIASISGSIAHAFYGDIPDWMTEYCNEQLDMFLKCVLEDFWKKYPQKLMRTKR